MAEKRTHIVISAPITEMENAFDLAGMVKVDSELIKEITDGDDNPKFLIVDIEETKSGNNIVYDQEAFELIAKQVNEKLPVGYAGHKHFQGLDKEDLLPDPQALWVGATVVKNSAGKSHLIAKAYLPPEGKARNWLKRKLVNSVSWAGDAILTPTKDGYKIKDYFLESIDFARKNKEGLKGQRLVVVTEEMDDKPIGGKVDTDAAEIVGKLVYNDLLTLNPGLVTTIKEMQKTEDDQKLADAVVAKEDELVKKHETELAAVPEVSMMEKIRQLLGINDDTDPVASLTAFIEQLDDLGKKAVKAWFDSEILSKKIPNEKARKLIGRLIPVTEMQGDWRSDKGIEKIKTALEERIDDALENDDDVKSILKEMSASRGGLKLAHGRRGGSDDGDNNNDTDDDNLKNATRSGNLELSRVKVGL